MVSALFYLVSITANDWNKTNTCMVKTGLIIGLTPDSLQNVLEERTRGVFKLYFIFKVDFFFKRKMPKIRWFQLLKQEDLMSYIIVN